MTDAAMNSRDAERPFLTSELPGIGGTLKHEPEDFVVEEIPAFPLTGEGEHLYLWIEKRDTSHDRLLQHLARALQIPRSDIGSAGMKDRRAVTRQHISIPAKCEPLLDGFDTDDLRILSRTRHPSKLRTGKLKGNRFSILVREIAGNAAGFAEPIRERLLAIGFPNYFGDQRFGIDNETLQTGLKLLRGEMKPRDLPGSRRRFLLRLSLSAVQSWLFNRVLADRIRDGLADRVLEGDVLQVCASGGIFVCDDLATDQQRCAAGEIVVTGPLFGPKMRTPQSESQIREQIVLDETGFSLDAFSQFAKLTPGTRRPMFIRPEAINITEEQHGLRFEFALPSGCYATELLREFMK